MSGESNESRGAEVIEGVDAVAEVMTALRDYATELAEMNPDNPYAQACRDNLRAAKRALADARNHLRQALEEIEPNNERTGP